MSAFSIPENKKEGSTATLKTAIAKVGRLRSED